MRCLVTGGLGFIGSHLVRRLRELGHDAMVLDDSSNAVLRPIKRWANEDRAGDITDVSYWPRPYFDWVFHLAAVSRTPQAIADPIRCHQVNATGSLVLLDWIRTYIPTARVVLASSNIVYGSPNPYRASKLAMEEYMSAYNQLYGLNCIALRYSNVYGPGMRWDDSICLASMRRSMVEKGYIELTGDGNQSRDFTHVPDIVEGTILAAQYERKGILDLTSGEHRSMNAMATYFGCPVKYVAARPGDTKVIIQDRKSCREVLGWVPKVEVSEGIKGVLAEVPQEVRA